MATNGRSLGWRAPILQHFSREIAKVSRVSLVSDPDHLLAEQRILAELQQRGFEVIAFDDPVAFRFVYESRIRSSRADENAQSLVVTTSAGVTDLPYDLVSIARQDARTFSFSLGMLFPQLSPNVVLELDREDLDRLFQAQEEHKPDPLGENATKDFVLRYVYEVAPDLIKSEAELLRVLLRRHYFAKRYAPSLDERFIALIRRSSQFENWPLEVIVPDRTSFITFLQERWAPFVRQVTKVAAVEESLVISGVLNLPFDHPDVRVYVDSFFIEGVLKPIKGIPKSTVEGTWVAIGVAGDEQLDIGERFTKLTERVQSQIPAEESAYSDWTGFAFRWAEWNLLRHRMLPAQIAQTGIDAHSLQSKVESAFESWMLKNFGSLSSLPYLPHPVMVHQIAKVMSHGWRAEDNKRKLALIVVDGLALDQWLIVRDALGDGIKTQEEAAFAWVPTLTPISRQSIFAAEPPLYFASSLDTTGKEEQHWRRFWENAGARRTWVTFIKQRMQEHFDAFLSRLKVQVDEPGCCILGAVVGVIDETLHGTVMGSGALHAQIRYWAEAGNPRKLLEMLLDAGFEIILTADHGNVAAVGIGKPNVGVVAEQRGERAHVFTDATVRRNVHACYPTSIVWPSVGLPADYLPLIASGASAFIGEGQQSVSHGGISLEEVIVPLIRVSRNP